MNEYCSFLFRRFVLPQFMKGSQQVHVLFDNPNRQPMSPKVFEQRCRDGAGTVDSDHQHTEFDDASSVPSKWRENLKCRMCK